MVASRYLWGHPTSHSRVCGKLSLWVIFPSAASLAELFRVPAEDNHLGMNPRAEGFHTEVSQIYCQIWHSDKALVPLRRSSSILYVVPLTLNVNASFHHFILRWNLPSEFKMSKE